MKLGEIKEKVFLKNSSQKTDVSRRHSIVCQTPFCIAVRLEVKSSDIDSSVLIIEVDKNPVALLNLKLLHTLKESNESILIFQITTAECFQQGFLQKYFLLKHIFKNKKHPYLESKIYAAIYSYPRKVIIVSFKDGDYYNIFPMDFQGYYPEENIYLLGLRTTNITLSKIINAKQVAISNIDTTDVKTVYDLGAHHGTSPPKIKDLPFKIFESEALKFPIPEFASEYKEVEIIKHYNLGSHTMLVGKVVNSKKIKNHLASFYHVHFFEQANVNYPGAS
ncbi:MAG TPA: hypothetical protein VKT28_18295 [Puia sp.]|nr:hypothetical protein [Puia sp.]